MMQLSDEINVGDFHKAWKETMAQMHAKFGKYSQLTVPLDEQSYPEVPEDLLDEISSACGIDSLKCAGESSSYEYAHRKISDGKKMLPNVDDNVDLETLKKQEERLARLWNDYGLRKQACKYQKHTSSEMLLRSSWDESDEVDVPVDEDDVILSVLVCRPARPNETDPMRTVQAGGVKYLILGSQFLTELRDKIACSVDLTIPGDFSDNPKNVNGLAAKELYKSGFFFVNGTFYNDMRDPTAIDYSKVIIDWAQSDPSRLLHTPYRIKMMNETRFSDITIQLGHICVFMHQGNCQHLVVFTDLRLANQGDCMNRVQYPIVLSSRQKKKTLCMICHLYSAKWLTRNNPRLPAYTFLFCEKCFFEFNYDQGGNKIGSFTAQPYLDGVATL